MASTFTCPCEKIRQWHQTKGVRTGWDALGAVARNLWRFRRKSARIEPAGELASPSQRGCVTCLLVCRAIETLVPLESVSTIHLELSNFVGQLKVTAELAGGDGKARQEFYIYHPEGYKGHEPFGPGSLRAPEQPRAGPFAYNVDAVICNTHFFIRSCSSHGCGHGGYIPTRLLSVGHGRQDGSDDSIRLIEPWQSFSSPFAALSHCWGQSRPAVTTKANYASRQSGILLSDLPRTFQDAVWIARRLGIGYIWIDSLCIIQDDAEDWDREAMDMYRIYGAAYVTLAAAHGVDGDAGLFPPATEGQITPLDLETERREDGKATTVSVNIMAVPRLDKDSQVHRAYSSDEVSPSDADVLQTRGWALQERALSNRVVHFNAQEMVYECRRLGLGCDCGGVWTRESFITQMMGSLYYRNEAEADRDLDDMSIDGSDTESSAHGRHPRVLDEVESDSIWAGNVKTFTTKALTKPNDRLSAFAGIAQTFQQLVDDPEDEEIFQETGAYCAGLWEKSLPGGLMWSCATDDMFSLRPNSGVPGSTRIENAHAPTWSWCSVTGPCTLFPMGRALNERDMHVDDSIVQGMGIDFAYESTTGSPFGRLSKAELTLRRVALCRASRASPDEPFVLVSREEKRLGAASSISIALDDPDEGADALDVFLLPLWLGYHEWLLAKPWDPSACSTQEEMEAYYEEHFPPVNPNEQCKDHRFGVALVSATKLQPGEGVAGNNRNRYRRLGIFHMKGPFCAEMQMQEGMWFAKTEPVSSAFTDEVMKSLRSEAGIILV